MQPAFTVKPLVTPENARPGLRQMLLGHAAPAACYEAHREDGGVYLLWMELSRFGTPWAYPCVLHERGRTPRVFRAGAGEANRALLARWEELTAAGRFAAFRPSRLEKKDFQRIFQAYQRGEA